MAGQCSQSPGCQNEYCCNLDNLRPPKSLQELIEGLKTIFARDKINVEFVKAYMRSYKGGYEEWGKYAIFDQDRYTRNLVDEGNGKFNLIVLCWNLSQGSSIHSHANSHCFMKILDGTLKEELFDWPKESGHQPMNLREVNTYKKDEVAYINDDLGLHRVLNPSHTEKAVSLHLYSPPFDECKTFDQKTGHEDTAKVTFWSKFGQRTPLGKEECCTPENN